MSLPDNAAQRLTAALAGRYTVEREIGAGGMATVYLAHDLKHNRKVALKVLLPELAALLGAERFLKEIEVTANLQHPHILPLFDSGVADQGDGFRVLYYVMPLVEGETLREQLNREKQLSIAAAVEVARSVAAALDYAHRQGVIHRDIKPENVLLHDGQAMVADFGIALAVREAGGTRLTGTGLSVGTPSYMSPEQAMGDRELDARSDIYSLGAMLYEMLAGEPPFTGGTAQAVVAKILTEAAPPVTRIRGSTPANVAATIHRALERLPADRFASAAEFAAALADTRFTVPQLAGTAGGAAAGSQWNRLSRSLAGLAAVLVVVALWAWLRPGPGKAGQVVRMPLVLPDSAGLEQQAGIMFALTEDGNQLLYVGPGQGDINLYLRPLNALTATVIPGTEGGDSPFLSPDGAVVAFYRNVPNALFTVSLRGGPRQTVVSDSMMPLGGDWGPDGAIYFTRTGGIRRFLADGGQLQAVTTVDGDAGELAHAWPDVLPSGKGAVFTIERRQLSQYDIAAIDFASGTVAILFRGTYARYAPTGHLIYTTAEGGLFAIGFDQGSLKTRGAPIPVVDGVVIGDHGVGHFALSPSGALLYGTGKAGGGRRSLEWVNRAGQSQPIDPDWRGDFAELALSPDGRHVAVAAGQGSATAILIKELDRGPLGTLTPEQGSYWGPAWTPDGRSVTYAKTDSGRDAMFVRRADGSAPPELLFRVDKSVDLRYGFLSPDGQWLIYAARLDGAGDAGAGDIFARRTSGDTTPVPIAASPAAEFAPRLSPDGRWLAYTSNESGRFEIYVRPFPDAATFRAQISTSGGTEAIWSPDGRELFYSPQEGEFISAAVETSPTFRVRDRTPLFPRGPFYRQPSNGTTYAVAGDGQRFLMNRIRGEATSERLVMVFNWFDELKAAGRP